MKKQNLLYWLIPIFLIFAQALFTFSSFGQVRYEDLAESARNPFWMQNRLVYDGVSGSVWWYMLQAGVYNIFGYTLFTTKILRLVLFGVSIIALSIFLKKVKVKYAAIPLLALGLSPSWLYLNTLSTSYGTDIAFIPIILFLLLGLLGRLGILGGLSLSMIAWLSYPVFVYYLLGLGVFWWGKVRGVRAVWVIGGVVMFLIPLVFAFLFVKNPGTLMVDEHLQSGLFRGAGSFVASSDNFTRNIAGVFRDLFVKGDSYHFELWTSDFSYILPAVAIFFVVGRAFYYLFKKSNVRWIIFWILVVLFSNLIISSFTDDPSGKPGIRRYTASLVALYALFVAVWHQVCQEKLEPVKKWIFLGLLLVIPVQHILVLPFNLAHISDPSLYREGYWFSIKETPASSLQVFVDKVQDQDLELACRDETGSPVYCRYSEIFAAVSGYCYWNHLECHGVKGYDFNTGKMIPLTVDLWRDWYFEH